MLIPNKRWRPPLDCRLGTKPSQAANCLPFLNDDRSPTAATRAVAVTGPIPSISPGAGIGKISRSRRSNDLIRRQVSSVPYIIPVSATGAAHRVPRRYHGPVRTSLRKRPTARTDSESSASALKGTYSHAKIAIGRLTVGAWRAAELGWRGTHQMVEPQL